MTMIFSADRNWGIGRDNNLLFRASGDMRRFRKLTTGKVVIMGYNTLISLPKSNPLPDRTNIVLSRKPELQIDGAFVCECLDALFGEIARYPKEDVFVIGGEQVYRLLLPYSDNALVTKFDDDGNADRFMENLDVSPEWRLADSSERFEENCAPPYTFNTYVRVQ